MLSVVVTDATFKRVPVDPDRRFDPAWPWFGKCVHCNTGLLVAHDGRTSATLEHIVPLCAGGSPDDPHNLALACAGCNNRKGIEHDQHAGKDGRADEVIRALQAKRLARWREPVKIDPWVG